MACERAAELMWIYKTQNFRGEAEAESVTRLDKRSVSGQLSIAAATTMSHFSLLVRGLLGAGWLFICLRIGKLKAPE